MNEKTLPYVALRTKIDATEYRVVVSDHRTTAKDGGKIETYWVEFLHADNMRVPYWCETQRPVDGLVIRHLADGGELTPEIRELCRLMVQRSAVYYTAKYDAKPSP